MSSHRHYSTRATTKGTSNPATPLGIRKYFRGRQDLSPGAIVSAPRALRTSRAERGSTMSQSPSPTLSLETNPHMGTPAVFRSGSADTPHGQPRLEDDLRAMLQALPTRADIESLIQRVEEAHRRDIQEVKTELNTINTRVTTGENLTSALEARVLSLEQARESQAIEVQEMQLHIEEMEDRSRRNNLRLRGIPEATGSEDLAETVTAIFHRLLETPPPTLEIDRVHRTLGPRSADPARPRDVLCRLHRYAQKETILRKAWENGDIDFDGAHVQILPDISRATLQRRAMLKPALEAARSRGCTYRWGYPLAVIVRSDDSSFTLRSPADLPAFFTFLGSDPVQVPNWLMKIPRPTGRTGLNPSRPIQANRSRSQRGRSRVPVTNRSRES